MQIKYIDKIISFPPKERNDSISSYFSQAQRFLIKARFDFLDAQQKCRFVFLNITLVHVWMYTIDFFGDSTNEKSIILSIIQALSLRPIFQIIVIP